jgi:uncharacterized repeat protein (TIGR03837 family)
MNSTALHPRLDWDIFCRVIDNFGDIGVCWRLCVHLALLGQRVRLWVDDASALRWMAPGGAPGIQVLPWHQQHDWSRVTPGDVLVEAFGCEIDPEFVAHYAEHIRAGDQECVWINLEYLSAEPYAARCHTLPSPVMSGPGKGLTKHFFYPGFTSETGGLLREPDLLERQAAFDRSAWLAQLGGEITAPATRWVSLFCYEPAELGTLLKTLASDAVPTRLLVTAGRSAAAVRHALHQPLGLQPFTIKHQSLSFFYLPELSQREFDHLLWSCDLNFVRGEDSLVRALWAGKPFVWQIYPQDDDAHHAKLHSFLDWLQAPSSLRRAHDAWNGLNADATADQPWTWLTPVTLAHWQDSVSQARDTLLAQNDLAHQLLDFVSKTH